MAVKDRRVAVVGAFEHATRHAPDMTEFTLLQECAAGALEDAGLGHRDLDGLCTISRKEGDLQDPSPQRLADYFNIDPRFVESTYVGGASLQFQLRRAAMAIEQGLASCILLLFADRPRSRRTAVGTTGALHELHATQESFEDMYGVTVMGFFALLASRHMALYGTSEENLAEVAVAFRKHAQLNPNARYRDELTVDDVLQSRMISSPLRLLNCCVITDGGGALILASEDVARRCKTDPVWLIGAGERLARGDGGYGDWLDTGLRGAATQAFDQAGIGHADVDTVQIYDATSFHPIQHLEELGFCKIGEGGAFIDGGKRISLGGELPVNTDGGGMSSNSPASRGIFVVIEAVRQLRGDCGERQVSGAKIALASANGGGGAGGRAFRRSASVLIFAKD
jgi:acetyl-CoA C-acetyltransferase